MHLLMVSHGYPPIISGVTLVVQKIARAMVRKGHTVTVITASEEGEPYEDRDRGVRLVRVRTLPNPVWKEGPIPLVVQKQLEEIVEESRPDLLHAHDGAFLGVQLWRLGRNAGLPTVATCYYVPRFIARYLTWKDEPLDIVETAAWIYSSWLYDQFDHVVFATRSHREYFLQQGLDTPTTIISNGIDTARYSPQGEQSRNVNERYNLPDGPRILFVGRLAQDKEIDVLIRAMPTIFAEEKGHLLLVGRGDDRERLMALTQDLGLAHCVHFLGFVPEEDLPELYRASDLFAIASLCEVQSLPTLQAVATGLPVVAADAVALPELVRDGVNGFLVSPRNPGAVARASLDILCDPERAAAMGEASLSIARLHAEDRTFDGYEALYLRMIQDHKDASPMSEAAPVAGG